VATKGESILAINFLRLEPLYWVSKGKEGRGKENGAEMQSNETILSV
jgi:hypothetical protein